MKDINQQTSSSLRFSNLFVYRNNLYLTAPFHILCISFVNIMNLTLSELMQLHTYIYHWSCNASEHNIKINHFFSIQDYTLFGYSSININIFSTGRIVADTFLTDPLQVVAKNNLQFDMSSKYKDRLVELHFNKFYSAGHFFDKCTLSLCT